MDYSEATRRFQQLTASKQIIVLAAFGSDLTVVARDTYVVGELGLHAPERLREINEIQHRVLAHILALTTEDDARYPDDVLLSIFFDYGDEQLQARTLRSLERAMNRHGV